MQERVQRWVEHFSETVEEDEIEEPEEIGEIDFI